MRTFGLLAALLAACSPAAAQLSSTQTVPTITRISTLTATITPPPVSALARRAVVTITVTSWTTEVVTVTEIDTVIETVTQWVPPATSTTVRSTTTTSTSSSRSSSTTQPPPAPEPTQTKYGQCGGSNYVGATKCAAGSSCSAVAPPWYYQCL